MGTLWALIWLAGGDFINSQATHQFNQVVIACQRLRVDRGTSPRMLVWCLLAAEVSEDMKRGDIPEGLTFGVKVLRDLTVASVLPSFPW